jgi:uncharacterized protein (TIGR03000 family)
MYTMVLMTAMSGVPDATAFGGRLLGGYNSCHGCTGYVASCYGCCGGYASCYGCCGGYAAYSYSCSGCCGGGPLFPRLNAFFRGAFSSCHGCTGYVASCYGCCGGYASCFGCCGGFATCYGCCGGIYTGSAVYGGCYGTSCIGCVGCHGCFGGAVVLPAIPAVPTVTMSAAAVPAETVALKPAAGEPTSASLLISLPANAKLFVDGQLVAGDGTSRRFHTPPLAAGSFFYELRAEVLIGGRTEVEDARVVIKAGDTKEVGFGKLLAAVARADSAVASR